MVNQLFHKLATTLRKQGGPTSAVVPFGVGRIYKCSYRNWKHDPQPLILIIGSDAFHTVGININYLGAMQSNLIQFIMLVRTAKMIMNGMSTYQLLKRRYPAIPRMAFRMYFTSMLRGKLVHSGLSTQPEPNIDKWFKNSFLIRLDALTKPKIFPGATVINTTEQDEAIADTKSEITSIVYNKDASRPFANIKQ